MIKELNPVYVANQKRNEVVAKYQALQAKKQQNQAEAEAIAELEKEWEAELKDANIDLDNAFAGNLGSEQSSGDVDSKFGLKSKSALKKYFDDE